MPLEHHLFSSLVGSSTPHAIGEAGDSIDGINYQLIVVMFLIGCLTLLFLNVLAKVTSLD